jgi:hypothetical protein
MTDAGLLALYIKLACESCDISMGEYSKYDFPTYLNLLRLGASSIIVHTDGSDKLEVAKKIILHEIYQSQKMCSGPSEKLTPSFDEINNSIIKITLELELENHK